MSWFSTSLWFDYFKVPIDSRPDGPNSRLKVIRDYFFSKDRKWFEVYELIEFTLNRLPNTTATQER